MKTRGVVRDLLSRILNDFARSRVFREHNCRQFDAYNTGCLLCATQVRRYALLHAAFMRKFSLVTNNLTDSERLLLEVVGPKRMNNILSQQTKQFLSGPEIKCKKCSVKLKYLGNYSDAYKRASLDGKGIRLSCSRCGIGTLIPLKDLKIPKHIKNKLRKPNSIKSNQENIADTITNDTNVNFGNANLRIEYVGNNWEMVIQDVEDF